MTELQKIIEILEAKEKADGCKGCAFSAREEWEMPCSICKRNHKDYWRPKAVSK